MLWGIVSLVLVGLSWTLVGAVAGMAPRKGVDPGILQLTGSFVSICCCLLLLFCSAPSGVPGGVMFASCLSYGMAGALNCVMLVLMSGAMQRGPNGIIWAVIQSAMIFPFLFGILFFHVEPKMIRFAGFFLILSSLVLFGLSKNNTVKSGGWRKPAFSAFLITGILQILANLPSYFESARAISPVVRTLSSATGVFCAAVFFAWRKRKEFVSGGIMKSKYLWIFTGILQLFGLICAFLLLYPGIDALAANGIGAAAYPIMIGSCIVGFSLYSILLLREKNSPRQYFALGCCTLGIILICL